MEKKFLIAISNTQNVLKIWRMRNLTLDGKIRVFKTLAFISCTRTNYLCNQSTPKTKHSTLCNYFETGGLTKVDINTKIASLAYSWIKRLNDNSFHE